MPICKFEQRARGPPKVQLPAPLGGIALATRNPPAPSRLDRNRRSPRWTTAARNAYRPSDREPLGGDPFDDLVSPHGPPISNKSTSEGDSIIRAVGVSRGKRVRSPSAAFFSHAPSVRERAKRLGRRGRHGATARTTDHPGVRGWWPPNRTEAERGNPRCSDESRGRMIKENRRSGRAHPAGPRRTRSARTCRR